MNSPNKGGKGGQEVINPFQRALNGSFLPSIAFLKLNPNVSAGMIIDENQGLNLLHCACFYGNLNAIKAYIEVFNADCNQTDYRGQSPLHILVMSGHNNGLVYLCERQMEKEHLN